MNGLRVALSGALEGLRRSDFREQLDAVGAEYVASLDETVDVLVVGDEPLQSKVSRAEALDIEVVPWAAFQARLEGETAAPDAPLAEATEPNDVGAALWREPERLVVLDIALPMPPPSADASRVPDGGDFAHYTLDAPTLRLLRFLARAVALGHPCLIEGDTATSKTSAIRYLAAQLQQPVVRLNLNGQTDASELVGRFVPDGVGWRFQEGLVPQAMRCGWWVILDEVNLAEPAVLERLNPVLERQPSLVLTEGDGARIGAGGAPVHPGFHVFATMNPAEYQGRSVLSPAWRDRFVATWQADAPGELELRQMLRRLVLGEHPVVRWGAARVQGAVDPAPPYGRLAAVPGIEGLLARLASVHAAMATMASPSEGHAASLGVRRRERYVFSRRGLLGLLDALATLSFVDGEHEVGFAEAPARVVLDAVEATYVDRVRGDEDRARVRNVLRTMGLVQDGWVDPFVGAD